MDIDEKYREIGLVATVLCQKHLENPKKWDATEILAKLFDKFEQLELEEDIDD